MTWASQVKKHFYCCKQCCNNAKKGKPPHNKGVKDIFSKPCLNCEKLITGQRALVNRRKFCSKKCNYEFLRKKYITENGKPTNLYLVWGGIKNRCYNPNSTSFKNYGFRGIEMCNDWKNDYQSFKKWCFENGYEKGLSIERIDNDKGYYPDNCKFATKEEQANNRTTTVLVEINGEIKTLREFSKKYNIKYETIRARYNKGKRGNDLIKKENYYNESLITKEKLYDLYLIEKKSTIEISKMFGLSSTTIYKYLKKHKIPIRDYKESVKLSWNNRKEVT